MTGPVHGNIAVAGDGKLGLLRQLLLPQLSSPDTVQSARRSCNSSYSCTQYCGILDQVNNECHSSPFSYV